MQEELLKQVRETGLYKKVTKFLSTAYKCSRTGTMLGHENSLSDVAAAVCCEGAEILTGQPGSPGGFCCEKTCVKQIRGDGGKPITLVSGTVKDGLSKQGMQILLPYTQQQFNLCFDPRDCSGMHPAGNDVLTVLLLALPMQTWSGIKDKRLVLEMANLISAADLPTLLKEEVSNLCLFFNSLLLFIMGNQLEVSNLCLSFNSLLFFFMSNHLFL